MEWLDKLIGELPEIDLTKLKDFSFSGIEGNVWIFILALLFTLGMMVLGYRKGIVAELSGLLAIVGTFIVLRIFSPTVQSLLGEMTGAKRFLIYTAVAVIAYFLIKMFINFIGKTMRHVPVIGFLSGVLGALAGLLKALVVLIIVQLATDIDILGAFTSILG